VRRVIRPLVVMLSAVAVLAACQSKAGDDQRPQPSATTSPQVVDDGNLAAGQPVDRPRGDVVLTVSGQIATHNKGKKLVLDLASLERMRTVRLETTEPFLKRRVRFDGVMLSDLLAVAGVPSSASKLHITALDDYKVDFTLNDVRSSQMLLATKADGKRMPIDRAGPIRVVFPDSSSLGRNPDLWIWSVSTMQVS
jgi:hypothetical protein